MVTVLCFICLREVAVRASISTTVLHRSIDRAATFAPATLAATATSTTFAPANLAATAVATTFAL